MRILCDMDGVVADIMPQWLAWYNKDWGDNLKITDIHEWGLEKLVKPECGLKILNYLGKKTLFRNALPYEEAKPAINKLLDAGHDFWFVTKSTVIGHYLMREKMEWVREHYPRIGPKRIIFMQKKGLLKGDVMIDDFPVNFDSFGGQNIVFDRPWNQSFKPYVGEDGHPVNWFRSNDWDAILALIADMSYEREYGRRKVAAA